MIHRAIQENGTVDAIARGLGWFSIALGLAELLAPRQVTRPLGMADHGRAAQLYGMREMAVGVGLLAAKDPAPWLWGRVAGDVLDLASLATGLRHDNPERGRAGLAMGAVAAITLLDLCCASQLQAAKGGRFRKAVDHVETVAQDVTQRAVDAGQDTADRAKDAAQDAAARVRNAGPEPAGDVTRH